MFGTNKDEKNGLRFVTLSHIGGMTKLKVVYKDEHSLKANTSGDQRVHRTCTYARVMWAISPMWCVLNFARRLCIFAHERVVRYMAGPLIAHPWVA
ncbi:hypothetical protein HanIR_Chr10g0497431 [Helianthus annuus]|nr:hypothetical protein HanIR_Chr10g0497431 [Helianthus annuus]